MRSPLRWALLFVMATSAGCGARPTSPEEKKSRLAQARAEYDQALNRALTAAGLVLAPMPNQAPIRLGGSIDATVGTVYDKEHVEDSTPQNIVVYAAVSEDHPHANPPTFVRDAEGKLYLLQVARQAKGYIYITEPGCASGWDSGVTPSEYYLGYPLPENEKLAGTKAVTLQVPQVITYYAEGSCDRGPPKP